MKVLKHLAGILLAATGALFVLGAITHLLNPDPEVPLWGVGIMFVLAGLLPLVGAFTLLRTTIMAPSAPCPKCGAIERHPAGILQKTFNPWIFHFGGWFFSCLWGASREQQVRCAQCDSLYLTDTRGTRIAGVLLWVLILLVLFGLLADNLQR